MRSVRTFDVTLDRVCRCMGFTVVVQYLGRCTCSRELELLLEEDTTEAVGVRQ
jgi:hypothetical protein